MPIPPSDDVARREAAWAALEHEGARLASTRLVDLVGRDGRLDRLVHRLGPLRLDLARQAFDETALDALIALAQAAGLGEAIRAMYAGERVNRSEARAALHVALRAVPPAAGDESVASRAVREALEVVGRVDALAETWRREGVTDLVHVGIGGSDLGPRLVCEALSHLPRGPRVHFVANVDGTRVDRLVRTLDPATTRISLVSKSFTTQETLLNANVLRRFFGDAEFARSTVVVTSNVAAARAWGIDDARILPMWDWVGGRYSVWSAVGLPIAVAYGPEVFRRFREGARVLDEHYASAPFERNLPVLLALAGIWNRNVLGHPTHAVIAYDDRLAELPAFLQQLEMESNGKRVDEHGRPLARPAAPVIWGQVGTNAQHAFFQSLHQGIDTVPLDLVAAIRPSHALAENHRALLANLVAQSAAFLGGSRAEAEGDPALRAQKASPGDRPHSVILLDELTPESLGMLLALYEHKVHAQGRIWGVDSFDQWGVELGKTIAKGIEPALAGAPLPEGTDAATAALVREIVDRSR